MGSILQFASLQQLLLIRGFIDSDASPAPRVWVTVDLIGVGGVNHPSEPIDFLIDTGASRTILHPEDAITRVGIKKARLQDRRNWGRVEGSFGIGGQAVRFIVPCRHRFRQDDATELVVEGHIRIAEATDFNESSPSLLGHDVLRQFTLTVSSARNTVLLDHPH